MEHSIPYRMVRAIFCFFVFFGFRTPKASTYNLLSESDAIIAIPFGTHRKGENIGTANNAMVNIMETLHECFSQQQLVAQWEMEDSNTKLTYDYVVGNRWNLHINSREFFESIREQFPNLKKITVVAHPDHMFRVVETAKKLGFIPVIPDGISQIPYDRTSTAQPWVQYRWRFFLWEMFLARPLFIVKDWM